MAIHTPAIHTKRPPKPKRSSDSRRELPRLYRDLAWIWPLLSPPEHYAGEAAALARHYRALGRSRNAGARPRLLELGAGGGHVLSHLCRSFECTAVDASPEMLEGCKKLVPGVKVVSGDMRSCRLGERFDLVLILDAIDYMSTKADARAALATAAAHLAPGGVLFVAPTYTRETFVDGETASDALASHGLAYLSHVHDANPRDARYELILVYLVRGARRQVELIEDRHVCGLFSQADWLRMLNAAGFDARRLGDDRAWSLFGGTLRARDAARSRPRSNANRL